MISFLKNNYYRISGRKYYIVISLLMTMISIILAVYLTSNLKVKDSIALVTKSKVMIFKSDYIKFTIMEEEPSKSQLVLGRYDGVIIDKGNGKYHIDTIKSDNFRKTLEKIIKRPEGFVPQVKDSRGVGTNIIGYLFMFILLQCVLFMFTLAEDMELKQIERIAASPVSFQKYLTSHFIFTFLLIFTPAFLVIFMMKCIFRLNIGFSLLQYGAFLGIICSFGIAFAMFINSIVKVSDTANMVGSSIVIITTILGGSFYSFEKGNELLEKVIWILPQKDFLSFVQGLETGKTVLEVLPQLIYVIIISLIFFAFSIIKIKKDYVLRTN
ncbi:ABC transporter permease [Clostridium sp. BJN0013]|uniref:ABC transporter permease n=1 Tax=Clostridium sp. BJN0013 TaxID=3236840 RepID=UPI0034C6611D